MKISIRDLYITERAEELVRDYYDKMCCGKERLRSIESLTFEADTVKVLSWIYCEGIEKDFKSELKSFSQ